MGKRDQRSGPEQSGSGREPQSAQRPAPGMMMCASRPSSGGGAAVQPTATVPVSHTAAPRGWSLGKLTAACGKVEAENFASGQRVIQVVEKAIREGRRQDAVDAIVTALAGQGRIDIGLLQDGRITCDASIKAEGVAQPPGYDVDGKAQPACVRVGQAAFTGGAALLHTSIMHEWCHVLQFQDVASSPSAVPGQDGGSLIDQQEVEAYCYEIEHAGETGLASEPHLMEVVWRRLHSHWTTLSAGDKAPLLAQATRCRQIAERVTGQTLVFRP